MEKLIIGKAPRLTSGQLRALARRAVLSAAPKAARERKEKALPRIPQTATSTRIVT